MTKIKMKIPAALLAGLMLSAPMFASAQDAPPPPHAERGPDGPHGGPHGGPFMHELRDLDLSATQRDTIRGYVESARQEGEAEHESLRSLRRSFDTAVPASAGYNTTVAQLANAEANAAQGRVQKQAALRAQVYSVLTDAQKAKLASELASLPEPPARTR